MDGQEANSNVPFRTIIKDSSVTKLSNGPVLLGGAVSEIGKSTDQMPTLNQLKSNNARLQSSSTQKQNTTQFLGYPLSVSSSK